MGEGEKHHHTVRFRLIYDDGESFNTGIVHELSDTGLFLETLVPLQVGDHVELTSLDIDEELSFEVSARVTQVVEPSDERTDKLPGMFFAFDFATDVQRAQLQAFIERLLQAYQDFEGSHDLFFGKTIPKEGLHRSPSGIWRIPASSEITEKKSDA